MTKRQLNKLIEGIINKKLNENWENEIYSNEYKTVTVSVEYASKANDLFRDKYRREGKQTSTTSWRFKNTDTLVGFVSDLEIEGAEAESEFEFDE